MLHEDKKIYIFFFNFLKVGSINTSLVTTLNFNLHESGEFVILYIQRFFWELNPGVISSYCYKLSNLGATN